MAVILFVSVLWLAVAGVRDGMTEGAVGAAIGVIWSVWTLFRGGKPTTVLQCIVALATGLFLGAFAGIVFGAITHGWLYEY